MQAVAEKSPDLDFPQGDGIERCADGTYRDGELIVAPHPSESMLAFAFVRFEHEDLLRWIFYEGVPSARNFISYLMERETLACYRQRPDSPGAELCGLGWLVLSDQLTNPFRKGEIGIGFFKGQKDIRRFGEIMTTWAFDNLKVSAIYGTTPEPNRAALAYIRRLGFEMFGPVPNFCTWEGKPVAAWISAITKEKWEGMNGRRR
jgi:hypothetical protein